MPPGTSDIADSAHWMIQRDLMKNDNVTRALTSVGKKFVRAIEDSNFYEEMGQCIDHCGYIGTAALYCESSPKRMLNFRSHYINQFYFIDAIG